MFVANFWDEVPDQDKEETRQHIGTKLVEMPAMSSFTPQEQLFFMDSKSAGVAYSMGLVTQDLSTLIDGLGDFVLKEQRRKLKVHYG